MYISVLRWEGKNSIFITQTTKQNSRNKFLGFADNQEISITGIPLGVISEGPRECNTFISMQIMRWVSRL